MKLLMASATARLRKAEYWEAKRGGNWCDNVENENREGRRPMMVIWKSMNV